MMDGDDGPVPSSPPDPDSGIILQRSTHSIVQSAGREERRMASDNPGWGALGLRVLEIEYTKCPCKAPKSI